MDEFERLVVITSGGDTEDRSSFQFRTAISILLVATELSLWLPISGSHLEYEIQLSSHFQL